LGPYIFVVAAILAVTPMLIIFKITMERIKEHPKQSAKAQTHFFIGVALSELIPIILIIYGFSNLTTVENIEELYAPGLIIILFTAVAAFFIFLQRVVGVTDDMKQFVHSFAMIALAMTTAIPMISIIALITMIP
jgi:F0F1-type ATP synthase membrane subunit c/vacuolar-type H+-ATPase subunit K